MNEYLITGYFAYKGMSATITAKDAKKALEMFLSDKKIKYTSITKMTGAENKKVIARGEEPWKYIDFTVENLHSNGMNATGNYHIEV